MKLRRIDITSLRSICLADIESFGDYGKVTKTPKGQVVFQDNGASVLAVAHLDTVQSTRRFDPIRRMEKDVNQIIIYNAQLDDRLGAYTLLNYLRYYDGVNFDVLLTEGEEHGASTAQCWSVPEGKSYNWIFSFDRARCDVVGYQYEDEKWRTKVKSADFRPGIGSYSDIADMSYCGVYGFNFGCGYQNNHSTEAYFYVSDYMYMVKRWLKFWELYKDEKMPWSAEDARPGRWNNWKGSSYTRGSYYGYDDGYGDNYYRGNSGVNWSGGGNHHAKTYNKKNSFGGAYKEYVYNRDERAEYLENYEIYADPNFDWMFDEEYLDLWEFICPHQLTRAQLGYVKDHFSLPKEVSEAILGKEDGVILDEKGDPVTATDPVTGLKFLPGFAGEDPEDSIYD